MRLECAAPSTRLIDFHLSLFLAFSCKAHFNFSTRVYFCKNKAGKLKEDGIVDDLSYLFSLTDSIGRLGGSTNEPELQSELLRSAGNKILCFYVYAT